MLPVDNLGSYSKFKSDSKVWVGKYTIYFFSWVGPVINTIKLESNRVELAMKKTVAWSLVTPLFNFESYTSLIQFQFLWDLTLPVGRFGFTIKLVCNDVVVSQQLIEVCWISEIPYTLTMCHTGPQNWIGKETTPTVTQKTVSMFGYFDL